MMPRVGLNPNTPQNEADIAIPPRASQAMASGIWQAATAAAALPHGLPAVRCISCGLTASAERPATGPAVRALPATAAPAVVRVLPATTAPASFRRSTTAGVPLADPFAGEPGQWPAGMPLAPKTSSMATGTPCRAPSGRPRCRSESISRACSRASSRSICVHARSAASVSSMRSRQAVTSSTEVSAPARIRAAASTARISTLA